jgi:hypothetical protein
MIKACFNYFKLLYVNGRQIFQKSRSHLQIVCARNVTFQFHTEDQQILFITAKGFSLLVRGIYATLFDGVL